MNGKLSFPLGSPQLRKVEGRGERRGSRETEKCLNQSSICRVPNHKLRLDGAVRTWQ